MNSMNSAIITGATSFVGSALVSRLLDQQTECWAIVRPESKNLAVLPQNHPKLHLVRGNAANPEEWTRQIPACDAFFHFSWDGIGAAGRADAEIQRRNVQMATDCLEAAAKIGCGRFIFAGSQAEYGICDGLITEGTSCHPVIEYGKGKLETLLQAEPISRERGIEYVHLRIFSVYGPGDHPWTLVSRCLDSFLENREIILSPCTQDWNFLYAEDAAEAISRFGDCALNGHAVFNVAGEETRPLKEYVEIMKELCGGGIPRYGALNQYAEPPHGINPDIRRMQQTTGWRMKTDFSSGIKKILEAKEMKA